MTQWLPDIQLDEGAIRAMLEASAPRLLDGDDIRLDEVARGWDNVVWRVTGADGTPPMLVRVPVREVAVPGARRELWLLDRIAPHTTLPIPGPITILDPVGTARWPGFAYPELIGTEAALAPPSISGSEAVATQLGAFLRTLHDPATIDAIDPARELPVDPNRRSDMPFRVTRTHEALDQLGDDVLPMELREHAGELLAAANDLPQDPEQVFLHGDLHLRHVLLDPEQERVTGVIDWGDSCRGSRSIDLALYWCLFEGPARSAFRTAYGPVGRDVLLRARVLGMFLATMLFVSAPSFELPGLQDRCREALLRTLR